MNYKLISNFFIFIYFIFNIIINRISSSVSFKYPYCFYLSNENIFVIHEKGITICDHLFNETIEEVVTFSKNDTIQINDLSKITTVFEDNYIFCLIKNKIYIFNDKGKLLFHNKTSIIENNIKPKFLTLVAFKYETNIYGYIINYFYDEKLYTTYFQYNIISNENNLIYYTFTHSFQYTYEECQSLFSKFDDVSAFTCQYMTDNNKNNLLVFFFVVRDEFFNAFYELGKSDIYISSKFNVNKIPYNDTECLKSAINSDHSKALISLFSGIGEMKSFMFDINEKKMSKILNTHFPNHFCSHSYFGFKVYYYKQNDEFINSCLNINGDLMIGIYDKDVNNYYENIKKIDKEIVYGYSILYSNCTQKYFLISQEENLKLLIGDNEELENIKNNFHIENCFINEENEIKEEETQREEIIEEEIQREEKIEEIQREEIKDESNYHENSSISPALIIIIILLCINIVTISTYLIFRKYKAKSKNSDLNEIFGQGNNNQPAPIN